MGIAGFFDSHYLRKVLLLTVCLPLLFAVTGGWQMYRTVDPGLLPAMEAVNAAIARVETIRNEHDDNVMIRTGDGVKKPATVLLNEMMRDRAVLEKIARYAAIKRFFAGSEIALGLLGALTGVWGIVTIRNLGRKAAHSRETLLRAFQAGIEKLPWLLGSIGLFTAIALAFGVGYEVLHFALSGIPGRGSGKIIIFGSLLVIMLVAFALRLVWKIFTASRAVFERDPLLLMGTIVNRSEAPKVWEFVEEIARKAGSAMPDGIVAGLDEGFFVTEHPVKLRSGGAVPSGRILYLSLPYLAFMERGEAAAVIGHELGHFSGADTEYSLRFSPIYAGAVNNLRAVYHAAQSESGFMTLVAKPALVLGEFFLDAFDLAVHHWSREREFAADGAGALVADSESVALSLLRTSVLNPLVCRALAECWEQGGTRRGGVLKRIRDLVREEGLGNPEDHLEEAQPHPMDSHPCMRQRLEALGVAVTPALLEKARCTVESGLLRELGFEDTCREAEDGAPPGPDGAYAGPSALGAAIEREFSHAARDSADTALEDLRLLSGEGREPFAVYEGGILLVCLWFFFALLGAAIFFLAPDNAGIRYGGLAFALGMTAYAVYRCRLRGAPFVVFDARGMLFPGQERPVPWTAVTDYGIAVNSVNAITTSVTVTIDLTEAVTPPSSGKDRRIRYDARKRRIRLTVLNLRGRMDAGSFSELFNRYWQAALARERLRELRLGK